ncbi:nucleobase:cation symporter-2 family protein [Phenylobacterium sp.]|uniref:nucleobase:cation symporter-2 family protein n=1 Tax=Phenylobacterium sp. TaxID=1871053 RepID=UPI00374D0034
MTHPVDDVLPPGRLLVLALQHVLTMYAGAVTVPLVIAGALHLATDQTAYLVSSDLVACGIVTLIQCIGIGFIGVRLPVMMGVTFVSVGPSIAIASNPALGLPGVFGATMVSGLIGVLIAPWFSRLSRLFAPVVTGTAMLLIGVSLMGVAINWIAGGGAGGAPGELWGVAIAVVVILIILGVTRFAGGFLANTAVLIGIGAGFAAAWASGRVDLTAVANAGWFSLVSPLHFGLPRFDLLAAASMTVVMLITMVESSGMLFALGRIVDKPLTADDLARGLRADAVGALVGGFLNSLPYTSYSQNVAIVAMTGVRSRFVCAAAGVMLLLLGTLPKLSYLVTAIPSPVLGGAALVMFGMVAANGVQTLGQANLSHKKNLYVVALGLGVGLIPVADERFFDRFPPAAASFLHNGVMLGIVTAVLLNLLLNRSPPAAAAASVEANP